MFLIMLVLFSEPSTPSIARTLAPVPEGAGVYLQNPYSISVDEAGRTYVADAGANRIFVWSADTTFHGTIGRPGDGPGELGFDAAGEPQAFVGVVGDQVKVFDAGKRIIHLFTREGAFIRSIPLALSGGRCRHFYFRPDGRYILDHHHYLKEPETYELWLLAENGKREQTLDVRLDRASEEITSGGRVSGVRIIGYAPQSVSAYNPINGELVVGFGDEPVLTVLDSQGSPVRRVRFPAMQRDVTKADREELRRRPWLQNPFYTLAFAEKKPYFTGVVHVGTDRYLVYSESPFEHRIEGTLIDDRGRALERVRFTCGENGRLFGFEGRVMALRTDEEGAFRLEELVFSEP